VISLKEREFSVIEILLYKAPGSFCGAEQESSQAGFLFFFFAKLSFSSSLQKEKKKKAKPIFQ
jgi:hypothetical protein